jgi:ribosome-interacting GTPase 1
MSNIISMGKIPEEAQKIFDEYEITNSLDEKIKLLTKFLSIIKDKPGTEAVQAKNQTKLNTLKAQRDEDQAERKKKQGGGSGVDPFVIKKGDNIMLALVSKFYNVGVGKTTILRNLTGAAKNSVGIFTAEPLVGVFIWESIHFLLTDVPAIQEGAEEGTGNGPKIFSLLRNPELICLCIDLSLDPEEQMNFLLNELDKVNIRLNTISPPIEIEKTGSGKIQVFFQTESAKSSAHLNDQIMELCHEAGNSNAKIIVRGQITLQEALDAFNPSISYKRAIIIATKGDSPNSKQNFQILNQKYGLPIEKPIILSKAGEPRHFHIFPLSITGSPDSEVRKEMMHLGAFVHKDLNLKRIYTKNKSGVAEKPIVFLTDTISIGDVAKQIHKELASGFKYAMLYREGEKMDKKRVGIEFLLQDKDVVEIFSSE